MLICRLLYSFQCEVSARNLTTKSETFSKIEAVLQQTLIHATHPSSASSIQLQGYIHGSSGGDYDGVLRLSHAPRCAFVHVRPESDGIIYPFSRYPRSVAAGDEISLCLLDMKFLSSEDFMLFYNRTDRVLVDPRFSPVAQSQVIFVKTSSKTEMDFALRHMTPIDKRDNAVLLHDDQAGKSRMMIIDLLPKLVKMYGLVYLGSLRSYLT